LSKNGPEVLLAVCNSTFASISQPKIIF
jgi:hypothetical protein